MNKSQNQILRHKIVHQWRIGLLVVDCNVVFERRCNRVSMSIGFKCILTLESITKFELFLVSMFCIE